MPDDDTDPTESIDERQPLLNDRNAHYDGKAHPPLRRSLSQQKQRRKEQKKALFEYCSYYVPILRWAPTYSVQLFLGDLAAGLTLACLLVPQGMSYARNLAQIDPVHGLFAASIPGFIYAVLGTCAQLSVGPEAALSLLIGQTISHYTSNIPKDDLHKRDAIATAVATIITLEAGLITFALGICRLGFLDSVLSRPLLRGFISAVGLVIFLEQLIPLLGLQAQAAASGFGHSSTLHKIFFLLENVQHTHKLTFILSSVATIAMIQYRILKPRLIAKYRFIQFVPELLLVVVSTTLLTRLFRWDLRGLSILGAVNARHVKPALPLVHWKYAIDNIGTAAIIGVMGYVDSIVAAKQNASRFNYSMSPNRELVAIGAANIAASFVAGTLPGFGSITRSRLNASTGARTPMASLLTATCVILTTYFLLPALYYLPSAILSSIILLVVYSILAETPHDVAFFIRLKAWKDLALMLTTFLLTFFWSVAAGITISFGLSLLLVVQKSSNMSIKLMGRVKESGEWVTLGPDDDTDEEVPGVLIARLRESINFSNAGVLKERLRRLERYGNRVVHPSKSPIKEEAKALVLHMADVDTVDPSAAQVLYEVIDTYVKRGTKVFIVQLSEDCYLTLKQAGIIDLITEDHVRVSVSLAVGAEEEHRV